MTFYHKLVAAGIALASLAGCVMNITPTKDERIERQKYIQRGEPVPSESFSVRPEFRVGVELARIKTKLPGNLRTTSHYDGTAVYGETTTKSPSGWDFRPKAGAMLSAGCWLRVIAGGEARWSYNSKFQNPRSVDAMESEQWDNHPTGDIGYVYTHISPEPFTFVPFVGLEATLSPFKFRVEAGRPYSGFELTTGHDMSGSRQEFQSEEWNGWGRRASASLMYDGPGFRLGVAAAFEEFKPDFGSRSEVESLDGMLQLEFPF